MMNKSIVLFAAVISLGILVPGCGSKSDDTTTKAPPVSVNAQPDPTTTGKSKPSPPAQKPSEEMIK
jgi:uncharacterized lipoprotein NlpE involved in copper resistance